VGGGDGNVSSSSNSNSSISVISCLQYILVVFGLWFGYGDNSI
jgi:hypothetical protein